MKPVAACGRCGHRSRIHGKSCDTTRVNVGAMCSTLSTSAGGGRGRGRHPAARPTAGRPLWGGGGGSSSGYYAAFERFFPGRLI